MADIIEIIQQPPPIIEISGGLPGPQGQQGPAGPAGPEGPAGALDTNLAEDDVIWWGSDTDLYRGAANELATDDGLAVHGDVGIGPDARTTLAYSQLGVLSTGTASPTVVVRAAAAQTSHLTRWVDGAGGIGTAIDCHGMQLRKVTNNATPTYTITATDDVVITNVASAVITLPAPTTAAGTVSTTGRRFTIKNVHASTAQVKPTAGVSIDGVAAGTGIPLLQWESIEVLSDGVKWLILHAGTWQGSAIQPGTLVGHFSQAVAQSIPTTAYTDLTLDATHLDTLSGMQAGRTAYRPPVAGWYDVSGSVAFAGNSSGGRQGFLAKNAGAAVVFASGQMILAQGTGSMMLAVPAMPVYLNGTTDSVSLQGYHTVGSPLNTFTSVGAARSGMRIIYLGP